MQPPVIPRVLLLVAAVATGVWLAAGLVANDGVKRAGEVVAEAQARPVSAADLEKARDGLERARRLGNDSPPLYAEIRLATPNTIMDATSIVLRP